METISHVTALWEHSLTADCALGAVTWPCDRAPRGTTAGDLGKYDIMPIGHWYHADWPLDCIMISWHLAILALERHLWCLLRLVCARYSLRLIKISHVNIWVQAAKCEIGEITTWNRLRNHWNKDLGAEICAKSDLGLFTLEQTRSPGCWDHVYCDVYTKSSIWGPSKHPVVYVLAAGAFFSWKMTPPDFLNTYIVNLVIFHQFEGPLVKFSKSGQSGKMTMPARRASKFCARSRSECPNLSFPDLESWWILGFYEPWSECQPEGPGLRNAKSWN